MNMADKFSLISIEQLLTWILEEEKQGAILGIHKDLFFTPANDDPFRMVRYNQTLETPVGVAAGPHTQMAQNIIAAWLTGGRYMELKTIQTLDELEVAKPCIDMEDAGYNCEWSQELRLNESFDEYLKAWIILHILRHKFKWDKQQKAQGPGFIFNMSVGYNLDGILKDNVQAFLAKMEHCGQQKNEYLERLADIYPAVKEIDIPDRISDNITLSTMHGCPPDEIEKIALYLVKEKKYHTAIKLNPTLLGPEKLRGILKDKLGFETEVPDDAFAHDLKYDDAVNIINSLKQAAKETGVHFGLKLTNTLESVNHRTVFPPSEKRMYMSGRALHPVSIALAAKVRQTFNDMDISFSAGADCFNIHEIIGCDLKPVTVCSDLLKPGGYGRLSQYLENLGKEMTQRKGETIEAYILKKNGTKTGNKKGNKKGTGKKGKGNAVEAALHNLETYSAAVVDNKAYHKSNYPEKSVKTTRKLPMFDCIQAPCMTTCPTCQDVPNYMYYTARGETDKAFAEILKKNPFPTVTGKVCDHPCQTRCTRLNYDAPLKIRAIKEYAADNRKKEPVLKPLPPSGKTAAIIGAGPSGLACAFYLALAGVTVTVYEAKGFPGGMTADAIPLFRLKDEEIKRDIARIEALGVEMVYNNRIDSAFFKDLEKKTDFIYMGIGAQESTRMNIEGEKLPDVISALDFLSKVRRGERVSLGGKVAIVGGGNSAMDAARTALREVRKQAPDGEVIVLYRRTRAQMPAADEEINDALEEGVKLMELTNPVTIKEEKDNEKNKTALVATCWKMKLGERDDSGRRRPVKIEGSDFTLDFDTIIPAIGQRVVLDFLAEKQWLPVNEKTGETAMKNLFVGGDALHGALNIVTAIGDGKRSALAIMERLPNKTDLTELRNGMTSLGPVPVDTNDSLPHAVLEVKNARRNHGPTGHSLDADAVKEEAERCLLCNNLCNVCVTVCPNRANVAYSLKPKAYVVWEISQQKGKVNIVKKGMFNISQRPQVVNIAEFCNHCGNCQTFCPTSGAPYKDKPRICLTEKSFAMERDAFYLPPKTDDCQIIAKGNGHQVSLSLEKSGYRYETEDVSVLLDHADLHVLQASFKTDTPDPIDLKPAIEMRILFDLELPVF